MSEDVTKFRVKATVVGIVSNKNYLTCAFYEGIKDKESGEYVYDTEPAPFEAIIYLDQYTNEKVNSFDELPEVKRGYSFLAFAKEENNKYYLSRTEVLNSIKYSEFKNKAESNERVTGRVVKKDRANNGLIVTSDGVDILLPFRNCEKKYFDMEDAKVIGTSLEVILQHSVSDKQKRYSFIGTRRPIITQEIESRKNNQELEKASQIAAINQGDVLKATVIKLEPKFMLVKIGSIVTSLKPGAFSYEFVEDFNTVAKVGDEFDVKVIEKKGDRIEVSRRALLTTPYQLFTNTYKIGDIVTCTLNQKIGVGMLFKLEFGARGFMHQHEYSWEPNDRLDDRMKVGDTIELQIIDITKEKGGSVQLSNKSIQENPWSNINVQKGDFLQVLIDTIDNKKGMQIKYQEINGYIPANEVALETGEKLTDVYKTGDLVTAEVIQFDKQHRKMKLSIRSILEAQEKIQNELYYEENQIDNTYSLGDNLSELFNEDDSEWKKNTNRSKGKKKK